MTGGRRVAVDSSIAIAAFGPWHERHEAAIAALERAPLIPFHSALETYSVLTRLPEPFRARAELAHEFIAEWFPLNKRVILSSRTHAAVLAELAEAGIAGTRTYDGLIAITLREAGVSVLTFDPRSLATYLRFGVKGELLE